MSDPRPLALRSALTRGRRRLFVAVAACGLVGLVAASVSNLRRVTLRCVDGHLVAHRGRALPFGDVPLDLRRYPPIRVPDERCETQTLSSIKELERKWVALTVSRLDAALAEGNRDELESAALWMELLDPARRDELVLDRQRAVLLQLIEADLEQATAALGRVRARLEASRKAGVDPSILQPLEARLAELEGGPAEPAARNEKGRAEASLAPARPSPSAQPLESRSARAL